MQTTLKTSVTFEGTGLHTGEPVMVEVRPAAANTGIFFERVELPEAVNKLPATWDKVIVSPLNTRLSNEHGTTVSTIEHIMAALAGCGVHNAIVAVDGPEVPIMDGSSAVFVRGLVEAGVVSTFAPLRAIEILKPVEVTVGDATAKLTPATSPQIELSIDFADAAIGRQHKTLNLANGAFVRHLADSRTFCRQADVDAMHAKGLALGGTLENAVVVDGDAILTPGGLRHADEAVRHKMLDALGDLMTAGAPILGRYVGVKSGHAVTNALLRALFADPTTWRWVICDAQTAARLPGVGLTKADLEAVA
ncbi:UDP-3-O-acyl-N-acetylglucosamine deacetylase [Cognatiyoonia sp.]|uniref:UDP-3-O-acyl-N-acetylglucosamine deacetylase n=1 Tax=Cognatiyoonia sp. TaxID=2211652 RepID=UPI003F69EDB9